jgi:hypothetical protein
MEKFLFLDDQGSKVPNCVADKASFLYATLVFLIRLVADAAPLAAAQCAEGL